MARSRNNSRTEGSIVEALGNKLNTPERSIGILSQTLSPSPTIRWILPARIRSKWKNDVVFVGENFVQLREFLDNGYLADVTAKLDLGSQVLAAKVITARYEIVSFMDQVTNQERDEIRYLIDGKPIADDHPPQLVVATLTSGELVYLYAKHFASGDVRFIHGKRRMLGSISQTERYGKHLAIDPESRAMAIASSVNNCGIFRLKPVDEIKEEIDTWDPTSPLTFRPTLEDRFLQVDGFILKMDFLPSTSQDPNKVILLLLVISNGYTSLLLYRWDSCGPLSTAKPLRCSGQRLPPQDAFPLMLIPSSKYTSFTIVTDTEVVYYDNVLSSEANRIKSSLPHEQPSNFDYSLGPPLYVQWAKPQRLSPHYRQDHDDVFLVREDGELRYLIVNYKSALKIEANFSPGSLQRHVDSAFTTLPGPPGQGGDAFLVGGDLNDGGVYHCDPRKMPRLTQAIPNMAPTQDMLAIRPETLTGSKPGADQPQVERLFTCSGKGAENCFVNELRFGAQAQMVWNIENPDCSSMTRLWALEDSENKRLLLLASHPEESTLLAFELPSLDVEFADADTCPGFDLGSPTLAMAALDESVYVQVTQRGVSLATFSSTPKLPALQIQDPILLASVSPGTGLVVLVTKNSIGFELKAGGIIRNDESSKPSYDIDFATTSHHFVDDEPIALCVSKLANTGVVIVSTGNGVLHFFLAAPERGVRFVSKILLSDLFPGTEKLYASSLHVLSRSISPYGVLLCGFRNGRLGCISISLEAQSPPSFDVEYNEMFDLGTATVFITDDAADEAGTAALVYCDTELRRIASVGDDSELDYEVSPVWLVDGGNYSRSQPAINAVCRIPTNFSSDYSSIGGLLIWAAEEELLISSLVLQEHAVPRRIKVYGTPRKLTYAPRLKKIVVAGNTIGLSAETTGTTPNRSRPVRPTLQLVDPSDHSAISQTSESLIIFGESNERICCLIYVELPKANGELYGMVLIGMDTDAPDVDKRAGRVMCVSADYLEAGSKATKKIRTVAKFPGQPVHALCVYGSSSFIATAGDDVMLFTYEPTARRFSPPAKFKLPSPATSLSVQNSFIFAGTVRHSLIILKENEKIISFHSADLRARNATSVLAVPGACTLITSTSNTGTTIFGFSEQLSLHRCNLQFEASVPLTIENIQQSHTISNQPSRHCFQSCTLDGTFYRFVTLQNAEWQLLQFLENLSPLRPSRSGASSESTVSADEEWEAAGPGSTASSPVASHFDPAQMHVHGDVLASLIRSGPCSLRSLLGSEIKLEDDFDQAGHQKARSTDLIALAKPVVGEMDDYVGGTTKWLRRLLRMP